MLKFRYTVLATSCLLSAGAGMAASPPSAVARIQASRELYQDIEAFWVQQIVALGGEYRPAALRFFSPPLRQVCGVSTSLLGPFYCPLTETVYLDQGFLQQVAARSTASANV